MAITKENFLVVYREGDSASLVVAEDYRSAHDMASDQQVSVPCTTDEILGSEAHFNTQVLNPLRTAIVNAESAGRTIWGIVLGYNVPGGFRDGSDVISSTSRISRIHHSFDKKLSNFLFNRKQFKRYDSVDADFALIVSRLDAPSLSLTRDLIDRGVVLTTQKFVNGTFYLDPYSDRHDAGSSEYQAEILDFESRTLPLLGVDTFTTTFLDPYIDVVIPSVTNESFVWSWFSNRGSPTFFRTSNALRTFFYNADFDGARTVRSPVGTLWPSLAIESGYLATAGAMSDPSIPGLLLPRPFFEALLREATLGEAYLFSLPFLDWTITMIGDPLLEVGFPIREDPLTSSGISDDEAVRRVLNDLGRTLAWALKKENSIEQIRDRIVESNDVATAVDLLLPSVAFYEENTVEAMQRDVLDLLQNVSIYAEQRSRFEALPVLEDNFIDFDRYLTLRGQKISQSLKDSFEIPGRISDDNVKDTGSWEFDFILDDELGLATSYHFTLDIASDSGFAEILVSKDSESDVTGWFIEEDTDEFPQMGSLGASSNLVGNRIRYESQAGEELAAESVYYVRVRQIDDRDNVYDYRSSQDIIFT